MKVGIVTLRKTVVPLTLKAPPTKMPRPPAAAIVPALLIPPVSVAPLTTMPVPAASIALVASMAMA